MRAQAELGSNNNNNNKSSNNNQQKQQPKTIKTEIHSITRSMRAQVELGKEDTSLRFPVVSKGRKEEQREEKCCASSIYLSPDVIL